MTYELMRRDALAGGVSLLALAGCAPQASPPNNQLQAEDPMRQLLDRAVRTGFAPGVVGLIARGGEAQVVAAGRQAFGGPPMRRDTIFRIASMTKPITATAVMMLVGDGRLRLDEPINRLLPELANRQVLRRLDGQPDDTVPASRPIMVEDLLTFRSGWGLITAPPGTYPIQRVIGELGIVGFGPPDPATPYNNDQWLERLGRLPLFAQPGERWMYTTGANIAGALIARATGGSFGDFLAERVFAPLGMTDSGFVVPPAKRDRFATAYRFTAGRPQVADDPATGKWTRPPPFEQGDGGLVSTADDFLAFARMLLAGGEAGGRRLLSREAVAAMTTNHLSPAQMTGTGVLQPGQGWGYGMAVVASPVAGRPQPGSFGWEGGFGTSWFSDPARGLTSILLTQHEFESPELAPLYLAFDQLAYQSAG